VNDTYHSGKKIMQGNIVEIIGAVVDVQFPQGAVPRVYDALTIAGGGLAMETGAGPRKIMESFKAKGGY